MEAELPTPMRASWGRWSKIGGKPHTVVVGMPSGFRFSEEMGSDVQKGVWLPLPTLGGDAEGPGLPLLQRGRRDAQRSERHAGAARTRMPLPRIFPKLTPAIRTPSAPSFTGSADRAGEAGSDWAVAGTRSKQPSPISHYSEEPKQPITSGRSGRARQSAAI